MPIAPARPFPASRLQTLGEERIGRARHGLPAEDARDELRGVDDAVERDAGVDAEAVEEEEDVFGGDVAGRPLRVRATAEAGDAGVEAGDADLEAGVDVADRLPVGVVEMAADLGNGIVPERRPLSVRAVRMADA